MKTRVAPHTIAGWLFILAAVLAAVMWVIYLFVATKANLSVWQSAAAQLRYTFSDANPEIWWWVWSAALPVLCCILGATYLLNGARTRMGSLVLFTLSVVLAIASFVLSDWALASFVALPAIWGYRAIHAT